MTSRKLNRRDGLFAMLGSLLWTAGGIITLIVGGGTSAERVWRTLLVNPALLLFMAGLAGFHARQSGRSGRLGKTGFVVCLLGTGTMLLGNIVEFWVSEYFWGTQTPGWVMMGIGLMMLPAGFIVLGIGTLRARVFTGWRRAVPLGFGLMLVLIVIALMVSYWTDSRQGYEIVISRLAPYLTLFGIALGWTALGYALWSEQAEADRAIKNTTPLPEPSRFWLALMRVPTWYYRAGFGWVFGQRMLLLTHIGRRSGLPRRAVLEVMRRDPATGTYYVGSGIRRERADWVRNINKTREVTVQVGRRRFEARAERLSLKEAEREIEDYGRRHGILFRLFGRLRRFPRKESGIDYQELARLIPVFALHRHP